MLSLQTVQRCVPKCIRVQGRERRIGTKYHEFGILLLDDTTGDKVHNLEHKYREDAERINTEILQEWVAGRGKQPVTWETLTEVLCDVELCTLASDIEAVKL